MKTNRTNKYEGRKKLMKKEKIEEYLKSSAALLDARYTPQAGNIYYLGESSARIGYVKRRPFLVISNRVYSKSLIICCEITSTSSNPNSIPFILNGSVSFIDVSREVPYFSKDMKQSDYYGTISQELLSLVIYTKTRLYTGENDVEMNKIIDDYANRILSEIESGNLQLRKPAEDMETFKKTFIGRDKIDYQNPDDFGELSESETDESETVYRDSNTRDSNTIFNDSMHKALSSINISHDVDSGDTNETSDRNSTKLQRGYWFRNAQGKRCLKATKDMNMKDKEKFLTDMVQFGSYTCFSKQFCTTGQTIKNRADIYVKEFKEKGILPEDIENFVADARMRSKYLVTPPHSN